MASNLRILRRTTRRLAGVFGVVLAALAVASAARPATGSGGPLDRLLVGGWTGTLEYRDYRTDRRVTLPTVLEVRSDSASGSLRFAYTYDDGPGKTVVDTTWVTIDPAGGRWLARSSSDSLPVVSQLSGLDAVRRAGAGTLTLTGHATDNDRPVETRTRWVLGGDSLSVTREFRTAPDRPYEFRHRYRFRRAVR